MECFLCPAGDSSGPAPTRLPHLVSSQPGGMHRWSAWDPPLVLLQHGTQDTEEGIQCPGGSPRGIECKEPLPAWNILLSIEIDMNLMVRSRSCA